MFCYIMQNTVLAYHVSDWKMIDFDEIWCTESARNNWNDFTEVQIFKYKMAYECHTGKRRSLLAITIKL